MNTHPEQSVNYLTRVSPLVSVVLLARHAQATAACLDMFIGQITTFDVEIVLVDCTPSGRMVPVYRAFASFYPHRLVYRRRQGRTISFGPSDLGVRGRYIVVCRDNERWVDPYKLQRQCEYLQEHPSCVLSFHNVIGDISLPRYEARRYAAGDIDFLHLLRHYSPLFRLEGTPGQYNFLLYERRDKDLFVHHCPHGEMQCLAEVYSRIDPFDAIIVR